MLSEDKYFQDLSEAKLWQRYCGFLDLSIDEFMDIQEELLLDEIERVADSPLGKKIMGNQKPKSVKEFRRIVPLTTYDDYEPYLSERREDVLAEKPYLWCHSAGRGGRFKWIPHSCDGLQRVVRNSLATFILASSNRKGEVNIAPGIKILMTVPPPPYTSGSQIKVLGEQFSFQAIPPPDEVRNLEFQERIQRGFQIALKEGVDIIGSLASILVRMGEEFSGQTRNIKPSASMLHPKIVLRLLRALLRSKKEKRTLLPKDLWAPKAVMAGGLDTAIYKGEIAYYWGSEPYEFYVCTEAFILAVQAWNKKGMSFVPDSAFLEFIPYEELLKHERDDERAPTTVLLDEVKEGELYEVVITQFGGMPLLRYRMNDIIRVTAAKDADVGIQLPQIAFQRRTGETIDLAGLAQLDEKTLWQTIATTGIKYVDWTASKEYDQNQTFVHIYLELKEERAPGDIGLMIDEQLKVVDIDYKDIDFYLNVKPVKVTLLSPGTFQRYMEEKRKEGADMAHLKPVHVNSSKEVIQRLLKLSDIGKDAV